MPLAHLDTCRSHPEPRCFPRRTNVTTATQAWFYHQGPGIDETLAKEYVSGGTGTFYAHADGLGSHVKSTDSTGSVVFSRRYDAFGNIQVGGSQGEYAFTGREWDPETSLYYYRARYYSPQGGRFISEDPIHFRGGNNFYAYVANNPVNRRDPTGHVAWGGGGGLAGAFVALPPGWGVIGDVNCYVVGDNRGNTGLLCCAAAGLAAGAFVGAGPQAGGIICPNCNTICDMESPSFQVMAGAAGGGGAMGTAGAGVSWNNWNIQATGGPAAGAGAFFGGTFGGCKLVWSNKSCKCP